MLVPRELLLPSDARAATIFLVGESDEKVCALLTSFDALVGGNTGGDCSR